MPHVAVPGCGRDECLFLGQWPRKSGAFHAESDGLFSTSTTAVAERFFAEVGDTDFVAGGLPRRAPRDAYSMPHDMEPKGLLRCVRFATLGLVRIFTVRQDTSTA